MIHTIQQDRTEKIICHGDSIIFGNRPEWSDATWRPLKLSLIRERQFFDYDPHETLPVIIWITGGAFGAEASVVAVVVGLAVSTWFIWRISKQ